MRVNKSTFVLSFVCVCAASLPLLLSFMSCASTSSRANNGTPPLSGQSAGGPYFSGEGRADIGLAVVPVKISGIALTEDELWYPQFVQGILTNDFTRFSAMEVSDRINLETVLSEQQLSMSGDFSDTDYISIGKLTNSQYILTGSLIKIQDTEFRLQLAVVDAEKGTRRWSYDRECSGADIQNGLAVKQASEDLLVQMGVNLTESGKTALRGSSVETDSLLARGITARDSGNNIETLNYFYSAVAFDSDSIEAARRLNAAQEEVAGNSAGAILRQDIKSQELWEKTLKDYSDFYLNHLPFELVFTQYASQKSTDYANRTYVLELTAGLRWTPVIDTMQRVLNDIDEGLEKTGRKDIWGFADWPDTERVFNEPRNFSVAVEILNDSGGKLAETGFMLTGQIGVRSNRIYATSQQEKTIEIPPISYRDASEVPDNFHVRIVSINQEAADIAGRRGYVALRPVAEFPDEQKPFSTVVAIQRERASEQRAAERQRIEEMQATERAATAERNKAARNALWNNLKSRSTRACDLSAYYFWGGATHGLAASGGLYGNPLPLTFVGVEVNGSAEIDAAMGFSRAMKKTSHDYVYGISAAPAAGIIIPLGSLVKVFAGASLPMGSFGRQKGMLTDWMTMGFEAGIHIFGLNFKYRGTWYDNAFTQAIGVGVGI